MPSLRSRRLFKPILVLLALSLVSLALTSCGGGIGGGNHIMYFTSRKLYQSVVAADLNGDGKTDIAVTYTYYETEDKTEGFVAVFLQNPAQAGSFLSPETYTVGQAPYALAVGDLNGDGRPDLAVVNNELANQPDAASNHVSVLLQDPANPGHFLSAVNYETAGQPTAIAIADLNGDGKADLAISDFAGISILLQNPATPGTFLPHSEVTSTGLVDSIAAADLNSDGKADLVATDGAGVQVLLQTQANPLTFAAPTKYSAGLTPVWVAAQDLNADGKVDLAVANRGSSNGGGASVSILFQDPAAPGAFLAAQSFNTGRSSPFLAAGDLNHDGLPDVAVIDAEGLIYVLLQNANQPGAFQKPVSYPCQVNASAIAIGDFNADGRMDLVDLDSDGIVIRLQDANIAGSFGAPVVLASQ
jgi:hypothetical protein